MCLPQQGEPGGGEDGGYGVKATRGVPGGGCLERIGGEEGVGVGEVVNIS